MAIALPTDGRHITYQYQRNTCGKITCGCHTDRSKRHGPYWRAYWRENGKLKSKYLGKVLMTDMVATDGAQVKEKA